MKIQHTIIAPRHKAEGHRTYLNRPGLTLPNPRINHDHLKRVREARALRGLDEGLRYA